MKKKDPFQKHPQVRLLRQISIGISVLIVVLVAGIIVLIRLYNPAASSGNKQSLSPNTLAADTVKNQKKELPPYFDLTQFNTDRIANPMEKSFILYGQKLVEATPQYLGPEAKNSAMRFSGNNLACSNCHLAGGTRPFSAPFIGVWGSYPNFRGRDNMLGTLEDRINGCMERSMNGKPLPIDGKEMKAMLAYIKFLNRKVPIGEKVEGQGFAPMKFPDRAADPKRGSVMYGQYCIACHGENGQGVRRGKPGDGKGYLYPPLWGPDSFNDGAGMHRLLTAARFIKANMPYGTAVGKPVLSDDEAYDVAAYINSFPRPEKANKEKDYPDLKLKPQDCPYPPYADTLPLKQHQLGPYVFNP